MAALYFGALAFIWGLWAAAVWGDGLRPASWHAVGLALALIAVAHGTSAALLVVRRRVEAILGGAMAAPGTVGGLAQLVRGAAEERAETGWALVVALFGCVLSHLAWRESRRLPSRPGQRVVAADKATRVMASRLESTSRRWLAVARLVSKTLQLNSGVRGTTRAKQPWATPARH